MRALVVGTPSEKVRAALALGLDYPERIAFTADPAEVPAELWGELLEAVVPRLNVDRAVVLLDRSLAVPSVSLLLWLFQQFGRRGVQPSVHRLKALLYRNRDINLLLTVLEELGRIGGGEVEIALLEFLGRTSSAPETWSFDLQVGVVEALGRVGTARSVPRLKEMAVGSATPSSIQEVCEQAAATIQARLGRAERGSLSLSRHGDGTLSMAEGGGELTEPSDES